LAFELSKEFHGIRNGMIILLSDEDCAYIDSTLNVVYKEFFRNLYKSYYFPYH